MVKRIASSINERIRGIQVRLSSPHLFFFCPPSLSTLLLPSVLDTMHRPVSTIAAPRARVQPGQPTLFHGPSSPRVPRTTFSGGWLSWKPRCDHASALKRALTICLLWQRRERVTLIASRVRAVPEDVKIVKEGREFILDDGKLREIGRAGYRFRPFAILTINRISTFCCTLQCCTP